MELRSPLKTIRAHCLDCCNGSANEVKLCPVTRCLLYPYRFGKNPNRRPRTIEDKKKYAEHLVRKNPPSK